MNLEYNNTAQDYLTHVKLTGQRSFRAARFKQYQSVGYWMIYLMLGAYAGYKSESIFLMCIFVTGILCLIGNTMKFQKSYWNAVEKTCDSIGKEKQIKMQICEDGIREEIDGILSFAPWTSIESFTLFQDLLIIHLASGLNALIPKRSLKVPNQIEEVVQVLKNHGIVEKKFWGHSKR